MAFFPRLLSLSLISCLALPGCGSFRKRLPLKNYTALQEPIQLSVKPLDDQECKEQFGGPITKKGYQPLMLQVENNSDSYYVLHPWHIGLPLAQPKRVAKAIHANTLWAVTGMIMTGLFIGIPWFAPLAYLTPLALPVGLYLHGNNKQKSKNVMAQAIDRGIESLMVPPHGSLQRYIFIADQDFHPYFTLTVQNAYDNKPVIFDVSLTTKRS